MLDRRLVEDVANALGTDEALVEKDWQVVRALGILATLDHGDVQPAFSGGTSLSKGWGLIKRFSEDIDFKIAMPAPPSKSKGHARRSAYREQILAALQSSGFTLQGLARAGNDSQYFAADFAYPSAFDPRPGLRPHLQIEMSFHPTALPTIIRPLRSLIAQVQQHPPEVAAFPCVDPVETAADKLSALAWRVCTRQRGSERDDPAIIRHLHDLAALESSVVHAPAFKTLVLNVAKEDSDRGGGQAPADPHERFSAMLDRLQSDLLWAKEYDTFVGGVSFAPAEERIAFAEALDAVRRLVGRVG